MDSFRRVVHVINFGAYDTRQNFFFRHLKANNIINAIVNLMFGLFQALKGCRGGGSASASASAVALLSKEGEGGLGGKINESDVSCTRLDETVRIPLENWPETLVVTAKGLRKEVLAAELLDKVCMGNGNGDIVAIAIAIQAV